MPGAPASGYIYALKDPRLPEGKNIVYIGNGHVPWESVQRHLTRSSNPDVAKWADELQKEFPEGLEILGRIVAERWHGEDIPLPATTPGITRIEWCILDYEEETIPEDNAAIRRIMSGTKKAYWIDRLIKEGHPLMNNKAGRPKGTLATEKRMMEYWQPPLEEDDYLEN